MIDFTVNLETAEITLRPLTESDFDQFFNITADKNMWYYFTSDLSNSGELKQWIDNALTELKNQTRLPFSIVNNNSGLAIGSSSLGNISYRDKRIEIGWTWISKEFQGKGVNNQIKYLMLKYCFENLDFERVEIKTDVLNLPARKALIRIGATEEGVLRSHTLMTNNRRRDTIFYSILQQEWPEIKVRNGWE